MFLLYDSRTDYGLGNGDQVGQVRWVRGRVGGGGDGLQGQRRGSVGREERVGAEGVEGGGEGGSEAGGEARADRVKLQPAGN